NHACFSSLTKKDGVFSCWNGDSPFHSFPACFSFTRRPTTSEAGSRARSSSRNWGVKRMGLLVSHRDSESITDTVRLGSEYQGRLISPGYSQPTASVIPGHAQA